MISRDTSGPDNRVVVISLSEHGKVQVEGIENILRIELKAYLKGIKMSDLRTYIRVLEKLADKS